MKNIQSDQLIINTMRCLIIDAIEKANSGHPGAAISLSPAAFTLFDKVMKHNPQNPDWINRDRFVLSAGHASMLLYSLLYVQGYDISIDDIKQFRQLDSICPGHPEFGLTPGVEVTSGPLAQGAGMSVGMAITEKFLAERYNKTRYPIFDYNIYSILGDGCMMEGLSGEAASLAGHLKLGNLIWIYDSNRISIEGSTSLAFSENTGNRFDSYNWHVQEVSDANDTDAFEQAVNSAKKMTGKPSLIIVKSEIAYGCPNKINTAGAHGSPLGADEARLAKENFGFDADKTFVVPDEVLEYRRQMTEKGRKFDGEWRELFAKYREEFPDLASEIELILAGSLPENCFKDIPAFEADEKGIATRNSSGIVLNAIAKNIPWLIGGSADLAPSNKTMINSESSFQNDNYSGRNFHFGVREHAMGAIANGMVLSKVRPYAGTFMVFSDYMRGSIRLAALMEQPVIYVFTHDSIGVGEDGPTHQPIEHAASLRSIPNVDVARPADANEVSMMWQYALKTTNRPVALILTRQNLPTIDRIKFAPAEEALKGAYIVADTDGSPDVILIGSGSELQHCMAARETASKENIKCRVVSMPCMSLFDRQDEAYKEKVLPKNITKRISIEAGSTFGWQKYTGLEGICIGIDEFGKSAPYSQLMIEYGFSAENVFEQIKKLV